MQLCKVLCWSWCSTEMPFIRCLAFWRRSWTWGDSWCCCLLRLRTWQCYRGKWIIRRVVWGIQHHHFRRPLADLQPMLSCKHGETGGFLLHVLMIVWDQRKVIGKGKEGPSDAPWSVRCCLLDYAVNLQVEEQRRPRISLSNTDLHTENGFAVSHSALEVFVEAVDDKNDLLWNSICPSTFKVEV